MRYKLNTFASKELTTIDKENNVNRSYVHDCVSEREIKNNLKKGAAVFVGDSVKARYIVDGYNIEAMRFAYVADGMTLEEVAAKDAEILANINEQ